MLEDRIRDLFGIEVDVNEKRIISIKDSSILGLQLDLLEKVIFEEKNGYIPSGLKSVFLRL